MGLSVGVTFLEKKSKGSKWSRYVKGSLPHPHAFYFMKLHSNCQIKSKFLENLEKCLKNNLHSRRALLYFLDFGLFLGDQPGSK